MYYISEQNNLNRVDKSLQAHTSKFGRFEHRLLTKQEIKIGTKRRFDNKDKKEECLEEIWKSFTVPIKYKSPAVMRHAAKGHSQYNSRPSSQIHTYYGNLARQSRNDGELLLSR